MKKRISFLLFAVFLIAALGGLRVNAETTQAYYAPVFDAAYYEAQYPDLQAAFGDDSDALFQHFIAYGMQEGRRASAEFDPAYYKATYPDLQAAFGDDMPSYYQHYISCGKAEGRKGSAGTYYDGLDYSPVYDQEYYKLKYPDLQTAFGDDTNAYFQHFVSFGMKEGRQASASFDPTYYSSAYPDLRAAFGNDRSAYYRHYIANGKNEGRQAVSDSVTEGINYAAVFNSTYYASHYPDLQAAFGDDETALLKHFVTYGMKEGRQGCGYFNVNTYRSNNPDLDKAFGNDLKAYYQHYITFGRLEGRTCGPQSTTWTLTQYGEESGSQGMFYTLQGDCGQVIVVDSGDADNEDYVRDVLRGLGDHVEVWILTHPHADHIGAFNELYADPQDLLVDRIYDDPVDYEAYAPQARSWDDIGVYAKYLSQTANDSRIQHLHRGDKLSCQGLSLEVWNAYDQKVWDANAAKGANQYMDLCNDGGLMFRISGKQTSMLFCADVSKTMESTITQFVHNELQEKFTSTYVQVGHHGNTTLSEGFYTEVAPKVAFFDAPDWLVKGTDYSTARYLNFFHTIGTETRVFANCPDSVTLQ